jgi:putative addiction module component (TIGR02574 family)
MNALVKELYEQARALPVEEQIELADLIHSSTALPQDEWEAAWKLECERRWAELEQGAVVAVDADTVFAGLKDKYGWQ